MKIQKYGKRQRKKEILSENIWEDFLKEVGVELILEVECKTRVNPNHGRLGKYQTKPYRAKEVRETTWFAELVFSK